MTDFHEQKTRWITEEQLGTVQELKHRGRRIRYKVPERINGSITLRFKGCGKSVGSSTGDLHLRLQTDRGADVEGVLWLSKTEAHAGCQKRLTTGGCLEWVAVPPVSVHGQVVSVKGLGKKSAHRWGLPFFGGKRGDLLVKLRVFEDMVSANFPPFDSLRTEDLFIEGWIYRRIDTVLAKLGNFPVTRPPFTAMRVAELFNERGWRGIAGALVEHLGLSWANVSITASDSLPTPGQCARHVATDSRTRAAVVRFEIVIHSEFLADPFAVAAILAHELCHLVESRSLADYEHASKPEGAGLMEMERTVDLIVFLFGLGEFQMRVARQHRRTLGYFRQDMFERMQVIVARKRNKR